MLEDILRKSVNFTVKIYGDFWDTLYIKNPNSHGFWALRALQKWQQSKG